MPNVYGIASVNLPWSFSLNSNNLTGDEQDIVWVSIPNSGSANISLSVPYILSQYGNNYQWSSNGYYSGSCINPFLPKGFICSIAQMVDIEGSYYTVGAVQGTQSTVTSGTTVTNPSAYGSFVYGTCVQTDCIGADVCQGQNCFCNAFTMDSFSNWTPVLSSSQSNNYVCGPVLSYNPPYPSTNNNNLMMSGNMYYCGLGNSNDASNSSTGVISSINVILATNNGSSYVNAFQMFTSLPGLNNGTTGLLVPYINPSTNTPYVGIADFVFTIPNASSIGPACFNVCPLAESDATDGWSGYFFAFSNNSSSNPNLTDAINKGYTVVPSTQQCFFIDPAAGVFGDVHGPEGSPLTLGQFSSTASGGITQVPSITIELGGNTYTYTYSGYITGSWGGTAQNVVNLPCMGQVNYTNNPNNSTEGCIGTVNTTTFVETYSAIPLSDTNYIATFNSSIYYIGSYNASLTSIPNNYPPFLYGSANLYQENSENGTSLTTQEISQTPFILKPS